MYSSGKINRRTMKLSADMFPLSRVLEDEGLKAGVVVNSIHILSVGYRKMPIEKDSSMIRKSVPMPMITVESALHRKFSSMFNPSVHQLHPKVQVSILVSTVMVNPMNNMRNKFIKKHFKDFQQQKHVVQNYNEMLAVLMSLRALFGIAHRMEMLNVRALMINQRILLFLLSSNHEIVFKVLLQAFYRNFIIVNRCKYSNDHR